MSEKSEHRRGYKASKNYFSKFRSFKRDNQGRIIGNKIGGSTEVIGPASREKRGFYGGWAKAEREAVKSKQVKKRRTGGLVGAFNIRMPRFRL
jgi:hypothetical protein